MIPKNIMNLSERLPKPNYGGEFLINESLNYHSGMETIPEMKKDYDENVSSKICKSDSYKLHNKYIVKRANENNYGSPELIIQCPKPNSKSVLKERIKSIDYKQSLENLLSRPNIPLRYIQYIQEKLKEKEEIKMKVEENSLDPMGLNKVYNQYIKNIISKNDGMNSPSQIFIKHGSSNHIGSPLKLPQIPKPKNNFKRNIHKNLIDNLNNELNHLSIIPHHGNYIYKTPTKIQKSAKKLF